MYVRAWYANNFVFDFYWFRFNFIVALFALSPSFTRSVFLTPFLFKLSPFQSGIRLLFACTSVYHFSLCYKIIDKKAVSYTCVFYYCSVSISFFGEFELYSTAYERITVCAFETFAWIPCLSRCLCMCAHFRTLFNICIDIRSEHNLYCQTIDPEHTKTIFLSLLLLFLICSVIFIDFLSFVV